MRLMNWTKIITELQESGLTQSEIGDRCDCAQSTISELRNGNKKLPNYFIGKALVDLHAKVVGKNLNPDLREPAVRVESD